jgi:hypothetical protein
MLALVLEDAFPGRLFLAPFLHLLPVDIRDQLAAQSIITPEAMVVEANCVFYVGPQGAVAVSAVGAAKRRSP